MSVLERLRDRAKQAARSVVHLPVLAQRIAERPELERVLAEQGLVPQRCGLCRFFVQQDWADTLKAQRAFAEAMVHLSPELMGGPKTASGSFSEEARALRPALTDRWADYGSCSKYGIGLNAFTEHPAMPETTSPPCASWT